MMRQWTKLLLPGVALAVGATVTLLAGAWELKAPFNATVNDHKFYDIQVHNEDCALKVKIRFKAPPGAYDSSIPNRNWYRFKARLELSNGVAVDSPVFFNRKPGARYYAFSHDSSSTGCWAKNRATVHQVDVEGCRGRHCKVQPFGAGQ